MTIMILSNQQYFFFYNQILRMLHVREGSVPLYLKYELVCQICQLRKKWRKKGVTGATNSLQGKQKSTKEWFD